jgi:hypothetical protein
LSWGLGPGAIGLRSPDTGRFGAGALGAPTRFDVRVVLCSLFGGEQGGVCRTEVGTVAGESEDPLLTSVGKVLGDEVGGVRVATTGHGDVGRGSAGVFAEQQVGGGSGVALGPVDGGRVGELDVVACVAGRDLAITCFPGQAHRAVIGQRGDGPNVAVGHAELCGVTPSGHPVADPDPVAIAGDENPAVVHLTGRDESFTDGLVEVSHLLAGVGHDERTGRRRVVGQCSGACGLVGVEDDLAALHQLVEHRLGMLA